MHPFFSGKLFSLVTINLFLPPSQLLVHPFTKFYTTSPRSPALHYAIAKQLMCYNILMIITAILLAVDINIFSFNYNLSHATQNLLVAANMTGQYFQFNSILNQHLLLFFSPRSSLHFCISVDSFQNVQ